MFNKSNPHGYKQPLDGITQKTLVFGENTLMTEFRLKQASQLGTGSEQHN